MQRILSIVMSSILAATVLTGCGEQDNNTASVAVAAKKMQTYPMENGHILAEELSQV